MSNRSKFIRLTVAKWKFTPRPFCLPSPSSLHHRAAVIPSTRNSLGYRRVRLPLGLKAVSASWEHAPSIQMLLLLLRVSFFSFFPLFHTFIIHALSYFWFTSLPRDLIFPQRLFWNSFHFTDSSRDQTSACVRIIWKYSDWLGEVGQRICIQRSRQVMVLPLVGRGHLERASIDALFSLSN